MIFWLSDHGRKHLIAVRQLSASHEQNEKSGRETCVWVWVLLGSIIIIIIIIV
jgi:hypothetical protein